MSIVWYGTHASGSTPGPVRVDAEWTKSPTARRILTHWADSRPAWLWSQDGTTLLWRNGSARLFGAKIKKSGLRLSADAVPIKGQVARLIRLGAAGRSSLSRVQFLAGDKPLSTTCSCTPLTLAGGETALLVVAIDPVDPAIREAAGDLKTDPVTERLLPAGTEYLVTLGTHILGGSAGAIARDKARVEIAGAPAESEGITVMPASPDGALLVLYAPAAQSAIDEVRHEEGESERSDDTEEPERDLADMPEPMLPMGLAPLPETSEPRPAATPEEWVEPMPAQNGEGALTSLFDRLAEDTSLYTGLTAADETFAGEPPNAADQQLRDEPKDSNAVAEAIEDPVAAGPDPESEDTASEPAVTEPPLPGEELAEPDLIAAVIEYADDEDSGNTAEPPRAPPLATEGTPNKTHWMITGRGFRTLASAADEAVVEPPATAEPAPEDTEAVGEVSDADAADRVSRYNFEELGRLLTDRMASEPRPEKPAPPLEPAAKPGVINLNAETLVLNRLPLAILVFRDQQVLFANRALTDLLGHDSVESLREAGIASIFPTPENASAGPVNQLVRRDGILLPVTARLQSVSWQGRPALMLSASPAEPVRGHEGAVRAFAEIAAEVRQEGFVVADRSGRITQMSGPGAAMLGESLASDLVGKPLAVIVGKQDLEPLREFLEKPARFAETARPHLSAVSDNGEADVALFAEGQAGIVTGYFGFLSKRHRIVQAADPDADLEPSMLARLSRGVRRPLNTIIGFADMLRASTGVGRDRQAEYAGDIRTAGLEIAVLLDELEDFTRLREGRYAPRPSDVDLSTLLEDCMARIRRQAGAARVLVRSAISEQLPRIRADSASLTQALLNLLASAIDQTPIGGSVILSAQARDDGGIAIHVRDGADSGTDLGERFVVFRDGVDHDGAELTPVRSTVGLALTRSLLAVNACSLEVDPMTGTGTLFSLLIPADLVVRD